MKPIIKAMLLLAASATITLSCNKKSDPDPTVTKAKIGEVGIEIHNKAGHDELTLGNTYMTAANESITIDKFNYYVSNIKLKKDDGTEFAEEESYHLVRADKASSGHFHMDVPEGSYTSMSFLVGVDAARNTDGAQTGALDPSNDMFWSWTTGYIMAKMEGSSPESGAPDNSLTFHIGGFEGENKGTRTVTINFMEPMVVADGKESSVHLMADALKWFSADMSFKDNFQVMSVSAKSKKIADNYATMFSMMH